MALNRKPRPVGAHVLVGPFVAICSDPGVGEMEVGDPRVAPSFRGEERRKGLGRLVACDQNVHPESVDERDDFLQI